MHWVFVAVHRNVLLVSDLRRTLLLFVFPHNRYGSNRIKLRYGCTYVANGILHTIRNYSDIFTTSRHNTIIVTMMAMIIWSLSLRHGVSLGFRLRNGLQYGVLRVYWISSRKQPTRSGPPVCGLGKVLTSPHCKMQAFYEHDICASGLDWIFGTTYENPDGTRPLGRPWRGWEYNIKMDLHKVGRGDME
jgi:hypothetical protein